jgi:hypothetical protein
MNPHATGFVTAIFILCFLFPLGSVLGGGQYQIASYKIGGGGESSNGRYVLTGIAGQLDAGYSEGGNYELLGGFWSGGPLCLVDFEHFARFAKLWLETGDDLPADLYEDGVVNMLDLELFVDVWLCSCPYNWPLR